MTVRFSGCSVRRILAVLLCAVITAAALCGCSGRKAYPGLPDDPAAFTVGGYTDADDDGASYGAIEFEGRTYLPYGIPGSSVSARDIDKCVGYIVMDNNISSVPDPDNRDTRVYTLTDDPSHNYLMDLYTGPGIMDQPSFWRAADTRGRDVYTPRFIDSLDYGYWDQRSGE